MENNEITDRELKLAEAIREHCVKEAKDGFLDASIQGLCSEGAMEAAVSAIQRLDMKKVLDKINQSEL